MKAAGEIIFITSLYSYEKRLKGRQSGRNVLFKKLSFRETVALMKYICNLSFVYALLAYYLFSVICRFCSLC